METSTEMARSSVALPFDTSVYGRKHFYLQVAVHSDFSTSLSFSNDLTFLGIRVLDYSCVNNCRYITSARSLWELSMKGKLWDHRNDDDILCEEYGPEINQGDIIGIHIDLINGILEFDVNKISLGVAARNINVNSVYYLENIQENSEYLSLINLVTVDDTLQYRAFRSAITKMSCQQLRDILPSSLENKINQLEFFTYCRGEEPDPQRFKNTLESPERKLKRLESARRVAEFERLTEEYKQFLRDRLRLARH